LPLDEWSKKRSVMQLYNLTAHIYDVRYADEQKAKIKAALESLNMHDYGMVLDVGCGTGFLFEHVAGKAAMTVGLDFSLGTLLKAKKRAHALRNVHVILADADNMPFKGEIFDFVFAFTLLQNMPNCAKTLEEVKRVAKAGAFVVVTGLKKAFTLDSFEFLLRNVNFYIASLKCEGLKCYVAVCIKSPANSWVKPA
jgi:demethylmenaquinone methyltransferase/2-methoxy-6-polyprenyl-1,4-benzoquinol methylase